MVIEWEREESEWGVSERGVRGNRVVRERGGARGD